MRWRRGVLVALGCVVAACASGLKADAPSPERPTISALRISPRHARSGGPVTIRFEFEHAGAAPLAVRVHWIRELDNRRMGSGFANLDVDREMLSRPSGEVVGVVTLVHPGRYWYALQVEDAAGRRSNVLEESFNVFAQPATGRFECIDGRGG